MLAGTIVQPAASISQPTHHTRDIIRRDNHNIDGGADLSVYLVEAYVPNIYTLLYAPVGGCSKPSSITITNHIYVIQRSSTRN